MDNAAGQNKDNACGQNKDSAAAQNPAVLAERLREWSRANWRDLPWRAAPGHVPRFYDVLLSEFMLQQTGVAAVTPRFIAFKARFPDLSALARAQADEVADAWSSLGYYRRAYNLHKTARLLVAMPTLPRSLDGLRALPGIGPYSAHALRSIAFGLPAAPVDANVERLFSRLYVLDKQCKQQYAALIRHVDAFYACFPAPDGFHHGHAAQALMDLGAACCVARQPDCALCPLRDGCLARLRCATSLYPTAKKKKARPVRSFLALLLVKNGYVYTARRPQGGIFAGMRAPPWAENVDEAPCFLRLSKLIAATPEAHHSKARHILTHFTMDIRVISMPAATENTKELRRIFPDHSDWKWIKPVASGQPSVALKIYESCADEGPFLA